MKFVEIFLQDKLFFDLLRSLKTFPSAAANYFVYVSIKKKKKRSSRMEFADLLISATDYGTASVMKIRF